MTIADAGSGPEARGNGPGEARGRLFLVPAPLDFGCDRAGSLSDVMPEATLVTAARLRHWVCENAKSARAYLQRIHSTHALETPIQQHEVTELPRAVHKKGDHSGNFDARHLLRGALQGHDIGLLSEAGMPAVADPGSSVVRAAHDLGLAVVQLVGPSSLLLALAASGLNGQSFAFAGYLPQEATQRNARIRELESLALKTGQAQLFIETPYRNAAVLAALVQVLQANTRLAVCAGLTLAQPQCRSQLVKDWKRMPWAADNSIPAVFAIGR